MFDYKQTITGIHLSSPGETGPLTRNVSQEFIFSARKENSYFLITGSDVLFLIICLFFCGNVSQFGLPRSHCILKKVLVYTELPELDLGPIAL